MSGAKSNPDRETLMMLISAYLDGELTAEEEAQVQDALAQDAELLSFFEEMAAQVSRSSAGAAGHGVPALQGADADALTASVLAATTHEVPDSLGGALQLASMAFDGCLDDRGSTQLDALLEKPASASAVAGFVASAEAVQVGARGVADAPSVQATLAALPNHVSAAVAVHDRLGALASAALDDALTPSEASELEALLPRAPEIAASIAGAVHVAEALRVASTGAAFAKAGAKAGEAALHAIEAERLQQATPVKNAAHQQEERPALFARLLSIFRGVRAPLTFAMGAAALFFVINERPDAPQKNPGDALYQELARAIELDGAVKADLPLLADNGADVEAIDATATTMVFSTESSNITVIWLADVEDDDASEQGT